MQVENLNKILKKKINPAIMIFFVFVLIIMLLGIIFLGSHQDESFNRTKMKRLGLHNLTIEAVLFSDINGNYKGFCNSEKVKNYEVKMSEMPWGLYEFYKNKKIDFSCRDSQDKFIASVNLENGNYICIDNTTDLVEIPNKPAEFSCKD